MILGKPKKKWRIMMITPVDRKQDTIIYPTADDVKEAIKMQYRYEYGQASQFTIGNVEHFF